MKEFILMLMFFVVILFAVNAMADTTDSIFPPTGGGVCSIDGKGCSK